jgi:hypothetical protein
MQELLEVLRKKWRMENGKLVLDKGAPPPVIALPPDGAGPQPQPDPGLKGRPPGAEKN